MDTVTVRDLVVLVDVLDAHRRMISRQRFECGPGPATLFVGRDVGCDVVLNDPYAAARHAEIRVEADGSIRIVDLGSVNGLIFEGERVREVVLPGEGIGEVQIGHSHLRMRTSLGRLAPERRDLESLRSRHREYASLVIGALLCAGYGVFMAWLGWPDEVSMRGALYLLAGGAVLVAWFSFWVLLGRAIRQRWKWGPHAAVALATAGVALWVRQGADVAVFATGLRELRWAGELAVVAIAALSLYLHLRIATRLRRARSAIVALLLPALVFAGWTWYRGQQYAGHVGYITPVAGIYPPQWTRRPGIRPAQFLEDSLILKDQADERIAAERLRNQR